jgi:hypothetical protein
VLAIVGAWFTDMGTDRSRLPVVRIFVVVDDAAEGTIVLFLLSILGLRLLDV